MNEGTLMGLGLSREIMTRPPDEIERNSQNQLPPMGSVMVASHTMATTATATATSVKINNAQVSVFN
jgi:hypothetical protein